MDFFPLHTNRLTLRPFKHDDLAAFTCYRNKPEVAEFQSWSSYSLQEAETFYKEQSDLEFDQDESWFQVALIRRSDQCLLGDVVIHFFDDGNQAEIGFTLDSDYQRQGYAIEAVSAVVELLFTKLNKHRLTAIIDVENGATKKLLQSVGFRQEAHYQKNIFFKGEWSDEYAFALLNSEFNR